MACSNARPLPLPFPRFYDFSAHAGATPGTPHGYCCYCAASATINQSPRCSGLVLTRRRLASCQRRDVGPFGWTTDFTLTPSRKTPRIPPRPRHPEKILEKFLGEFPERVPEKAPEMRLKNVRETFLEKNPVGFLEKVPEKNLEKNAEKVLPVARPMYCWLGSVERPAAVTGQGRRKGNSRDTSGVCRWFWM